MTTRDDLFEKEVDFFFLSFQESPSFLSCSSPLSSGFLQDSRVPESSCSRQGGFSLLIFLFFGGGETLKSAASGMIARKQRTHLTDAVMPLKNPKLCPSRRHRAVFLMQWGVCASQDYYNGEMRSFLTVKCWTIMQPLFIAIKASKRKTAGDAKSSQSPAAQRDCGISPFILIT